MALGSKRDLSEETERCKFTFDGAEKQDSNVVGNLLISWATISLSRRIILHRVGSWNTRCGTFHIHVIPMLIMCGAVPPRPHSLNAVVPN